MDEVQIEYGKQPLFIGEIRRDVERQLGRLSKNTRAVYYVTASIKIGPQTWGEVRNVGKYTLRKEQMDIYIKELKKRFPNAKVIPLGFE